MLYLLPLACIVDLLIPFILAPKYKGYSHAMDVMSVLGNPKSPVHEIYNIWLVLLGILLLIEGFSIYAVISQQSKGLAAAVTVLISIYAVGGCVLAGLFPVGETKSLETLSEKIHGYGAALGFLCFAIVPLLIAIYRFMERKKLYGIFSIVCFILAVTCFTLFVMADKPEFQNTWIAREGLWQRMSLLWMYLPISLLCI